MSQSDETMPSWQRAPCPRWCTREHQENDRDGDRDHTSEAIYVPVIRSVTQWQNNIRVGRGLVADELFVVAFQPQEHRRSSITIEVVEGRQLHLEMRDESAERLAEAMLELLSILR